jgi:methionyl-tRNA formyltransferase
MQALVLQFETDLMGSPNVIVFGYDELLLASMEFISGTQTTVSAVVFPSNRKDRRANKIREEVAERGLDILEQPPAREIGPFKNELQEKKPDLILVWSYPMILPKEVIDIPLRGCVNVHMGLLPQYRGVNGVRWALLNGEQETGVTMHYMDEGIDTGDMISRVSFPIAQEDDILSLMKKSRIAGLHLLKNTWPQIEAGTVQRMPQDESQAGYYSAAMEPAAVIDWSKPAVEIHNLIRASVRPFAGAHTTYGNRHVRVKRSEPGKARDSNEERPGSILGIAADGAEVVTGKGTLKLIEIEADEEVLQGSRMAEMGIEVGDVLGSAPAMAND